MTSKEPGSGIDLTPALDLVFITLLFFGMAAPRDGTASMDLSVSATGPGQRAESRAVHVSISDGGKVYVGGQPVEPPATVAALAKRANHQKTALIVSDYDAPTGVLIDVVDQIRLAGLQVISVSTRRAKP